MGKIVKMEFIKLKRYSVVKAGIIMTSLSALLSLFYSTADDGKTWTFEYFMRQVLINTVLMRKIKQVLSTNKKVLRLCL